jgi:hypothetical protein
VHGAAVALAATRAVTTVMDLALWRFTTGRHGPRDDDQVFNARRAASEHHFASELVSAKRASRNYAGRYPVAATKRRYGPAPNG